MNRSKKAWMEKHAGKVTSAWVPKRKAVKLLTIV